MRQQRVRMDQFDRHALLQYHQQAITQALAPQQAQKQMPCQLVFPDDTMAIGSPPPARGLLLPEAENGQETEEERQRRLLQNEPIVVYTSLSEDEVIMPEIARRGVALLTIVALQMVCIIVILTGGEEDQLFEPNQETPSTVQVTLYTSQLLISPAFLVAFYLWSVDIMKLYTVLNQLELVLTATLALRSPLDLLVCALYVPIVLLSDCLRSLMMPHCFMIRG